MNPSKAFWLLALLLALLGAYGLPLHPQQLLAGLCLESAVLALMANEKARRSSAAKAGDRALVAEAVVVLVSLLCFAFLYAAGFMPLRLPELAFLIAYAALAFAVDKDSPQQVSLIELFFMVGAVAVAGGVVAAPALASYGTLFLLMVLILWIRSLPEAGGASYPKALSAALSLTGAAVFAAAIFLYPVQAVPAAAALISVGRLIAPARARPAPLPKARADRRG